MDYKENFYEYTRPLFDDGILKEIYATDNFSICNVSDAMYVLFYHELSKSTGGIPFSFTFDVNTMKAFIDDELSFLDTVSKFGVDHYKKITLKLTENTINKYRELKKITDLNGPTKYIDRDFEEEYLRKKVR